MQMLISFAEQRHKMLADSAFASNALIQRSKRFWTKSIHCYKKYTRRTHGFLHMEIEENSSMALLKEPQNFV